MRPLQFIPLQRAHYKDSKDTDNSEMALIPVEYRYTFVQCGYLEYVMGVTS